jgi:hypothetical protein
LDRRIRLTLVTYAFATLGAFLLLVPWSALWTETALYFLGTTLGAWLSSGWVRGAVSGLGLLDLLVACSQARELWTALRSGGDGRVSLGAADG